VPVGLAGRSTRRRSLGHLPHDFRATRAAVWRRPADERRCYARRRAAHRCGRRYDRATRARGLRPARRIWRSLQRVPTSLRPQHSTALVPERAQDPRHVHQARDGPGRVFGVRERRLGLPRLGVSTIPLPLPLPTIANPFRSSVTLFAAMTMSQHARVSFLTCRAWDARTTRRPQRRRAAAREATAQTVPGC
jgi:hypothetical protein